MRLSRNGTSQERVSAGEVLMAAPAYVVAAVLSAFAAALLVQSLQPAADPDDSRPSRRLADAFALVFVAVVLAFCGLAAAFLCVAAVAMVRLVRSRRRVVDDGIR